MGIKNITDQSIRSTQNAISVVQAAEGARDVVGKLLQRVLTLTTQKENTLLNSAQTSSINSEITSLLSEVGKIRDRTRFQGGPDSIFGTDIALIAGAGVAARTISIRDLSVDDLGVSGSGSSKPIESTNLASLFSRQISASGISPSADVRTMNSVPPSSVTGSTPAVTSSAQASILNGGQSTTATFQIQLTASSVQPTSAALPVASIGASGGDVRFAINDYGRGVDLLYTANSGSSIQGLTNGAIYKIPFSNSTTGSIGGGNFTFQLQDRATVLVKQLGAIIGSSFNFQKVASVSQFNDTNVDSSGNTILGSFGIANGDRVVVSADPGLVAGIANLDLGKIYLAENVLQSGTSVGIKLKDVVSGAIIDLDATNANGSFTISKMDTNLVSFTGANISANTLNLTGSGFQVNDQVRYTTDNLDPNALQTGNYFVRSVTTSGINSSIQLNNSSGNLITFGGSTGGGTSSVTLVSRAGSESNAISISGHTYKDGDVIRYTQTNNVNKINGLNINSTYYVTDVSGNSFKLADASGNVQTLSSSGINSQTFRKGTLFSQPSQPSQAFADGAMVIYDGDASGNTLSGMTRGFTYTVNLLDSNDPTNTFQLLDSSNQVVISTAASGSAQLFRSISQQSYIDQNDAVLSSNSFNEGDAVLYTAPSSPSQIGGLITGSTYFIKDVTSSGFKLVDASGNSLPLSSSGTGLQTFTKGTVFGQPQAPASQFAEGARLIYDGIATSPGTAASGLSLNAIYVVDRQSNGSFQLINESTKQVAIISSAAAQLFRNADQLPYVVTDTITTTTAHGFQNGDAITYSSGNTIAPLTNNGTYYVRDVSGNSFKLAATPTAPTTENLSAYGSGEQNFTKGTVFSQPSSPFANGAKVRYGGVDGAGTVITGLAVSPAEYTVHHIGNGSSFQLIDSNNKVFSTLNAGTGNQIFNTANSSLRLQGHGFSVGDQVTYSGSTSGVGGDIGNLPRATYIVKAVVGETFELATLANAPAIIFTSAGTGTQQFTSGSGPISASSVTAAIQTNARYQAELGMQVNALNFAVDSMETLSSNLAQAYSRIMDVDYAAETAALTRNQIMQQAATSMLAQANQMPNVILTLLK
jgi:flagellin-like hook-associated protein FlgL